MGFPRQKLNERYFWVFSCKNKRKICEAPPIITVNKKRRRGMGISEHTLQRLKPLGERLMLSKYSKLSARKA